MRKKKVNGRDRYQVPRPRTNVIHTNSVGKATQKPF